MSQPYESIASGQQQVWRRWQVAGSQLTLLGTVFPILTVILVILSVAMVFTQVALFITGSDYAAEAILLLMRILLFIAFVVLMVVAFLRAARLRRVFLEVGPHGVVHHDGRSARSIPWTAIDRLYEPQPGQLGLLLRDGRSVTLTVPTKHHGATEVQAARHLILSQLGQLGRPPHPPSLR